MFCACGHDMAGAVMEAPGAASFYCVHGHRTYLFLRPETGEWETSEERQARMGEARICKRCSRKYRVADVQHPWNVSRELCNDCQSTKDMQYYPLRGSSAYRCRAHNPASPWRKRVKQAPAGAFRKHRDNPR